MLYGLFCFWHNGKTPNKTAEFSVIWIFEDSKVGGYSFAYFIFPISYFLKQNH
ncbi:hypothetical protein BH09BAC1_BH09BAC1_01640 [soil metagenome]